MRSNVRFRFVLLAPLVGAILAVSAPAAHAAVEIEKFVGVNCAVGHKECGEKMVGESPIKQPIAETVEPTSTESAEDGYRQAAGHVPYGITDFMVKHTGDYATGTAIPTGIVTHVRVDVAPGLATSPAAVPQCTMKEFEGTEVATGIFTAPTCKGVGLGETGIGPASTVIGEETATVYDPEFGFDLVLKGELFNLVQPEATSTTPARSALYGAALELPGKGVYVHTIVEGNVEWGKEAKGTKAADYHDYFEVKVSPALPLLRSRQLDYGRAGNGAFITNPTKCEDPLNQTTRLSLEGITAGSTPKETEERLVGPQELNQKPYKTLLGLNGCASVPFEPLFALHPQTTQQDESDGITTELSLKRPPTTAEIDSSQLENASIVLPEGMTLNPSAAAGLEACTVEQARIGSPIFGVACPEKSKIGTVSLEVPTLPGVSLTGNVYLGGEGTGNSITQPPYTVYLNAQSTRYGVDVRLKGTVTPNEKGRLTTTFEKNPEQPFSNLTLTFSQGTLGGAPLANPLACGTASTAVSFSPYAAPTSLASPPVEAFTVTNSGGGACASPLPFAPTQATANQIAAPGANTSFTFSLVRPQGQQYLSQVSTTLPEGLVGKIPTAEQCSEAAANSETVACPEGSKIGSVLVEAGSGSTPYKFPGQAYLTGPYNGAPFGMSIKVPALAGPFSLGTQVTRATININQYTGRVTVASVLPTIRGGIPLRIRQISVAINKQGFLINPTNCSVLQTESSISGFTPETGATATAALSTPFQVTGCGGLAFKPSFKAKTSAKTSKANGASLETTLNIGTGQTNFKSVLVQLPKQLPSRLTTLQKACPEAVFAANPYHCPSGSFVGGARANTPTLPGKLQGPAILVSHAGLAFPDLDLVMEANGVRVIVVGNTKISKGITTTTFASTPDVPVSSITVNLPIGGHSALTANGSLCINPLTMPTTLTGQNGFVVKQNTKITVASCGVRIAGKKVIGNTAYITVQTYSAGRISGSGSNLKTVYRHLGKAEKTATLKVPLSNGGLRKGRPLKVKLRVGFVPKTKSVGNSATTTTVVFG
jgi:hypothetical protein